MITPEPSIDVTAQNFDDLYLKIRKQIEDCSFVSFDCEFSGLTETFKESLFDSPKERYKKIQKNIEGFSILQLGLCIFKYDAINSCFNRNCYNFYLFPSQFSLFDDIIKTTAFGMRFLNDVNSNWGELFGSGLEFLKLSNEKKLMNMIENDEVSSAIYLKTTRKQKNTVEDFLTQINVWTLKNEPSMILECNTMDGCLLYHIRQSIINNHPNLIIKRYSSSKLAIYNNGEIEDTFSKPETILSDYFLGFTKVFQVLTLAKKPLVGHNCLKDLAMIYQQFVGSLPLHCEEFKREIIKLFPNIYDTKFLRYQMRHLLLSMPINEESSLENLYMFFKNEKNLCTPLILEMEGKFHSASFDAFCTGYCFIQFAGMCCKERKFFGKLYLFGWGTLIAAMHQYKNCLNVIRSNTDFIRLDGKDPITRRPPFLHVTSTSKVSLNQIYECLATSGGGDVKLRSPRHIMIAVTNHNNAKAITNTLRSYKLTVSQNPPWRLRALPPMIVLGVSAGIFYFLRFNNLAMSWWSWVLELYHKPWQHPSHSSPGSVTSSAPSVLSYVILNFIAFYVLNTLPNDDN